MKSKRYTILAFFKSKKIDYVDQSSYVIVPCIHCHNEVEMSYITSFWKCPACDHSGSLTAFMNPSIPKPRGKVFNARKEHRELNKMLHNLTSKYTNEPFAADLIQLQAKVNEVLVKILKDD